MANLMWFPIDPTLTERGGFATFSRDRLADELKPIVLDPGIPPFSQFKVMQTSCNLQTAASLGIGVGSASGSYNSFILNYEAMLFNEKIVENPVGGKIYGTRWGAGLRVSLKVKDIQSNIKIGFGAIAANTELGLATVEYEISGIGINSAEIIKVLPDPGDFNFDSYKKILDAVGEVKKFMAEHSDKLVPKPFQVFISDEINTDIYSETRSVLYAARNISDRNSLKSAMQNAGNKYIISVIKDVYAKYRIFDENQEPSKDQKRLAEEFLDI